jgi:MFS transporter, putative metabolite:H+ symporter
MTTTIATERTGIEVVQALPWRWKVQGMIFIIGGLGFMFDGWDVVLNAYLIPLMIKDWTLSLPQAGLIATINLAGMAVGAIVWGNVADLIGRKRAFTGTLLMFGVLSVAGALAPNYEIFLVLRFLAGIGLGGCIPVDYAMVGEFSPAKVRGRLLTSMDAWWPIGATLCGVVSTLLLPLENWRVLLLVMVLPALLTFWVRRSVPESPLFLIRKGRDVEARVVIDDLVRRTGGVPVNYRLDEPEIPKRMTFSTGLDQFRKIWAFNWKITAVSWALFSTVLFQYYGALIWLPTIFRQSGYSEYLAFMVTTGVTATGIVGVLASAWLVDQFGRKRVIMGSAILTAFSIAMFAANVNVPTAAKFWILTFGIVIEFAIPAIYCYVSELYPTELRASGFGWASSSSRVVAALVPTLLGGLLFPYFGLTVTFIITGSLLVLAALFMMVATPETQGRLLDDPALSSKAGEHRGVVGERPLGAASWNRV